MPGVSSRQPVSGMYGIGKIHLKFKPKPKKKFPFGALIFGAAVLSYVLVYLNSVPWSRYNIVIPLLRASFVSYGLLGKLFQQKEIHFNGLSGAVRVFKDAEGVSHVNAQSLSDALFGQGYLHASEHLYLIEMRRRAAKGRLAEVEGYHSLASDRLARVLDFESRAKADVENESTENKMLLRSYAAGINAYISSRRLPSLSLMVMGIVSVDEWTPEDTMMLMRLDAVVSSSGLQRSVLNTTLHIALNPDAAAEMLSAMESNTAPDPSSHFMHSDFGDGRSLKSMLETSWAAMSTAGSPLLATSLSTLDGSLNSWYINDISVASTFRAVGATKPGIPFVQHGHNEHIAWTILSADDRSQHRLHEETVRQATGSDLEVLVDPSGVVDVVKEGCMEEPLSALPAERTCVEDGPGQGTCPESENTADAGQVALWCRLQKNTYTISVRGRDDDVTETVFTSYRGPIITSTMLSKDSRFGDRVISLESPLLSERMSIQLYKDLNFATDTNALLSAISTRSSIADRILYATRDRIGYIPLSRGSQTVTPVEYDSGIIASSRHGAINHRIAELAYQNHGQMSALEFNQNIQCDSLPLSAHWFAKLMLDTLRSAYKKSVSASEEEIRARSIAENMLESFISASDYGEDKAAPVFVETLILTLKRTVLAPLQRDPELYIEFYRKKEYSTIKGSQTYKMLWTSDSLWLFRLLEMGRATGQSWWLNDKGGLEAVTLKAISEAIRITDKYFGTSTSAWDWTSLHASFITRSVRFPFSPAGVSFAKGLVAGPYYTPGTTDSIFQSGYDGNLDTVPNYGHPLMSKECPRSMFRMVVDMSDPTTAAMISGPGHSSEVESADYTSTAKKWAKCESIVVSWKTGQEPTSSSKAEVLLLP